jgi:hypothetical protein
MNKYFENEELIKDLEKDLKITKIEVQDLEEHIEILKNECDHTDKEGTSTLFWNSDPNHTVYTCKLCGQRGNWIWAREFTK